MASVAVHLQPGSFFAGINRPWYITQSWVRSQLRAYGFTSVEFHKRSVPLPVAVASRLTAAQRADTSWDEWAEAKNVGPRRDVNVTKHWSWLLEPGSAPRATAPATPSPAPKPPAPKPPAPPQAPVVARPAPWVLKQGRAPAAGAAGAGLALLGVAVGSWLLLRASRGR